MNAGEWGLWIIEVSRWAVPQSGERTVEGTSWPSFASEDAAARAASHPDRVRQGLTYEARRLGEPLVEAARPRTAFLNLADANAEIERQRDVIARLEGTIEGMRTGWASALQVIHGGPREIPPVASGVGGTPAASKRCATCGLWECHAQH